MNNSRLELSGKRFGRLYAVRATDARANGFVLWLCFCDCGHRCYVRSTYLTNGTTRSCGCLRRERLSDSHKAGGNKWSKRTPWTDDDIEQGDAEVAELRKRGL